MKYDNIVRGEFIQRFNRFAAEVAIDGVAQTVHVKNTGRCRELLMPGAEVLLEKSPNLQRKTRYDLVSVYKGYRLVNIDSQAPNKAFKEFLQAGGFLPDLSLIKPEATFGSSRLDFYLEAGSQKIFIEVKGATLEEDGVAMFPDAPTERGIKHIEELIKAKYLGYDAYIIFVIQMDGIRHFTPNARTHPEFAKAVGMAEIHGVQVIAMDCSVTKDSMEIKNRIKVVL